MITSRKHLLLIGALDSGGTWYVSPNGFDLYKAGQNDSIARLAGRYLGDESRVDEIWNLQSGGWRSDRGDDPNNLRAGDQLVMPQEAIDAAHRLGDIEGSGGRGQAPSAILNQKTLQNGTDVLVTPSTPSRPSPAPTPKVTPLPTPPPAPPSSSSSSKLPIILGGVVAAGVAVAGIAIARKHAKRSNPRRGRRPSASFRHHHDGA